MDRWSLHTLLAFRQFGQVQEGDGSLGGGLFRDVEVVIVVVVVVEVR